MHKLLILILVACILVTSAFFMTETVVQAQGLSFPAEINKSFAPISITAGGVSRLSVTIYNPNSFQLNNAAWLDNLIGIQPGIFIANPVNLTNTCGGTVTAVAGEQTLQLIGGTVPAQVGINPGACTVAIDVTSTIPGNLINTIPAGGLTSVGGGGNVTNTTPASATLNVGTVQSPTLSKSFNPNTMWSGQTSQLIINIRNNDLNATLTQASITDNLPANVILANPVSPILTNCGNSALLTAVSGDSTVILSNSTIPPNTTCVIRVNVTSTVPGVYTNTIPANSILTEQGLTNALPASSPLNVQSVGVAKAFSPPTFQAGGTTTLTITLQNPTGTAYTGVNITDTLPVVPNPNLTVVAGSATTTCGGTALATLPNIVRLTGGTIPAGTATNPGTCTITVRVTAPADMTSTTYTNTIPPNALTTDIPGVTNVLPATANVRPYTVGTGITGAKSFFPATINAGENSRLRIDIRAPADTDLTNFSIVDNLPANVTVSNSTPAIFNGCGAGAVLTATTGADFISLTNGTILAGTLCRIDVFVTSSTGGVHTNIIVPTDIDNNENRGPFNNLTANLTVLTLSDLSVSKSFSPSTVVPNGISTLTIVLQNTNASPLINVSALDTLPGNAATGIFVAPTPNASTTCAGGIITADAGTHIIQMNGGTIPAQVDGIPGMCTITVDVQGVSTTSPVTRTNTIPTTNVSGTIQGTPTTINPSAPASANLVIANLQIDVVKGFNPLTVFGGSASTMSVQLINPSTAALDGIAFTDNMPDGMIIADPANFSVGTCGGALAGDPGDASFSFNGGSLPANTSCTLTISITMTVNGNLTNVIPANAVTTINGVRNLQPAEASLTNLPGASISKAFGENPIEAGSFSLLTITIRNTGNVSLTGMGLSDVLPGTLPEGLEIAGAPAPAPVNNCGGTLTAVIGEQTIQLTNGSLAEASSCTIIVAVTSSTQGEYQNIIPAGVLTNDQGASNIVPAQDTLVVTGVPSGLTKAVSTTNQESTSDSNVAIGEIVTYQVGVLIPHNSVFTNARLVDTLDRGLSFVGCDDIAAPGLTTNVADPDQVLTSFEWICANPTVDSNGSQDPVDVGRRVTFDLGTLSNTGETDQTLTVTYRVVVLDSDTNRTRSNLNNSVQLLWADTNLGPASTRVQIVEPDLSIRKTSNTSFIATDTEATFTLTIQHTQASRTDAFDVIVEDVLPDALDFVEGTLDCSLGAQDPAPADCTYIPATRTIRAVWSVFSLTGGNGQISFRVRGNASLSPNAPVTNTGSAQWSSLPGDFSTPQSENPYSTERFYDPNDLVDVYQTDSSVVLNPLSGNDDDGDGDGDDGDDTRGGIFNSAFLIPVTGFAPGVVSDLSGLTFTPYHSNLGQTLEIPKIKLSIPIVGVPLENGNWDVTWLTNQAGWLEQTAFPGLSGNSVLTSHVVSSYGSDGPFARLSKVAIGDRVIVHAFGQLYIYEIKSIGRVQSSDISIFRHEDKPWLTLVTCADYDQKTGIYRSRLVVRAILIDTWADLPGK